MLDISRGLFVVGLAAVSITVLLWLTATFWRRFAGFAIVVMSVGWFALFLSILFRSIATGRGPFSNMYEFALAFAWGILSFGLLLWWRNRLNLIIGISTALSLILLVFAVSRSSEIDPLVPVLQQSALLSLHVTSAVIAYGAFALGFGVAVAYLIRNNKSAKLPETETFDRLGYQCVMIGFPFMTLTIILGAIWADISWGRYWGWDPKETASLVTWLIYAGYLHVRVIRGWRGKKSAIFLIIGFCAIIFTFFGNYIFQGLHSYL